MQPSLSFLAFTFLSLGLSAAGQQHAPQPSPARTAAQTNPPGPSLQPFVGGCVSSVRDQANPGSCLQASSVPTPGLLFPPPHDGGQNNVTAGKNSFIGGGRFNSTTGGHATIGGGQFNSTGSYSTVGGGTSNHAYANAAIGGGHDNFANNLGTVGGGGLNAASGTLSAIAGGYFNSASGYFSFVGGGYGNGASHLGSVAGGQYNSAGSRGSVGGGWLNSAFGYESVVSGGGGNVASGQDSAIPGGSDNAAAGNYSFAAGRRAKANHAGSFVWGDSQNTDKTSSTLDQFNVYASGGTRIFSDAAASTGVVLAAGSGSWSSLSDRAAKENLEPVDPGHVLERLRALPISTWSYKAQDESVRHMGPVAQDFHALFGLGIGDTTIDTIDADGVALAALQGLAQLVAAQAAEISALEARLARVEASRPPAR